MSHLVHADATLRTGEGARRNTRGRVCSPDGLNRAGQAVTVYHSTNWKETFHETQRQKVIYDNLEVWQYESPRLTIRFEM